MRSKLLIFIICITLSLGLFFSLNLIRGNDTNTIDMVYVNEVVKTTEVNWDIPIIPEPKDKIYEYKILKIDETNYNETLNNAYKNIDMIVDINIDGEILGKIIFNTNLNEIQKQKQNKLTFAIVIIYGILLILCISNILYLQFSLYKPFKKLKKFASSVASGNLDYPIEMDKNNIFGAFTESFDIMRTELKKAKHNENLANISKKELIASLSHDIKTPVASIKAISELLIAMSMDEKYKVKLNTIYEKSEQINRLITDMFNSTLEELGELTVNNKEEYSNVIYQIIKNADYNNKVTIDNIPDCIITTDIFRLSQVFDNIIANSYKYANTNIDINCHLTSTHIEININDYGKGISEDGLPLIFNKFYRGQNTNGKDGSGLGLYISKYLMTKQNGDINCYNRNDGFTVKLILKLV